MSESLQHPDLAGAEAVQALLAAIVESSDDAIISKTLEGRITSWNPAAERLFGYTRAEAIGQHISLIIPTDRLGEEDHIIGSVRAGRRLDHYETIRRAKDGRLIEISLTVSPVRAADGRIIGASKIARDISDRMRTERELNRYRHQLESIVSERTAALEQSSRRLRAAERAASLGTLAAGFGHDMANLLLPIFARLDAIEAELAGVAAPEVLRDLRAVRSAAAYLQRLSSGLRLMAMDPSDEGDSAATELRSWWEEVDGIFLGVLPRGVKLEHDGFRSSPPAPCLVVAIARHRLTQMVFNLVQNAGESVAASGSGVVRISAETADHEGRPGVRLSVHDNGQGMTDEVCRRCFEPYFSTKGRALSTGMGLSLVRALATNAGGCIEAESAPGCGATFHLWLPTVEPPEQPEPSAALGVVTVSLSNPASVAFATTIVSMLGFRVRCAPEPSVGDAMWVCDAADRDLARRFLSLPGDVCRIVYVADDGAPPIWAAEYTHRICCAKRGSAASLRSAISSAAQALHGHAAAAGSAG